MKFRILKLSEKNISKQQINTFVDTLDAYVNQTILTTLQDVSARTLLATAAPLLYAQAIKEKYHFNDVIATEYTHVDKWRENIKEEKKKSYLKLLHDKAIDPKKVILYTDHHDDLSLMKISDLTYLIQPSENTKNVVKAANISFEIIE